MTEFEDVTEEQIDQMAEAFYEHRRKLDNRTFMYRHDNPSKCLSEKTRELYRECMRAAVDSLMEET